MSLPAGFDIDNPKCPKCGGGCWDNRDKKRNPKSPDFKCKDKDCGEGVWNDSLKATASKPGAQQNQPVMHGLPAKSPITVDEWIATTRDLTAAIMSTFTAASVVNKIAVSGDVLTQETRSLIATFWMCVQDRTVKIGTGPEPKPEPKTEPKTDTPELGTAATGYLALLKVCTTDGEVDDTRGLFMADAAVSMAEKPILLKAMLAAKTALTKGA